MQSLIKLTCFALGFYEALLGLLNRIDTQFHVSYPTDHASSPCLPLSYYFNKKSSWNKSQKSFPNENKCMYRDGTLKNQPNKMGTTPQHIYTIPTSCAILPTMHNKKLSTHSLNAHGTQHCLLLSLPHKRRFIPDPATSSSSKIT